MCNINKAKSNLEAAISMYVYCFEIVNDIFTLLQQQSAAPFKNIHGAEGVNPVCCAASLAHFFSLLLHMSDMREMTFQGVFFKCGGAQVHLKKIFSKIAGF